MQAFFTVCLIVGVGYAALSFLLGEVFDFLDFDFSFDLLGGAAPPKPVVLAAFVAVLGGSGLIFLRSLIPVLALALALALGFAVSWSMYRFVVVPLSKAQNTSILEMREFVGMPAKVTEKIPQGRHGKITYSAKGNTLSAPAKSVDGTEIGLSEDVVIAYIDKNTYYVSRARKPSVLFSAEISAEKNEDPMRCPAEN
jgi:membrane protein implicated in regulation of membrane protease activity